MAITVDIKHKGIRRTSTGAEIVYLVMGTGEHAGTVDDSMAFDAVRNGAPTTWDDIPNSDIDVRQELMVGTIWEVAAIYGGSEGNSTTFPQSTVDYEFSFQAPAEKIYQSLETIGIYGVNGAMDPEMFGGALNVKKENGETTVEGLDLPGGTPTSTWVYKPLSASITDYYQTQVEEIMGDVNSFPFKNRAAGTMRFISCDGGAMFSSGVNPKWAIRFGFQFAKHRFDQTIGGIDVPFKGGHHLQWGYYEDDLHDAEGDDADNGVIKRPKFLCVERVFYESNFQVLGIG